MQTHPQWNLSKCDRFIASLAPKKSSSLWWEGKYGAENFSIWILINTSGGGGGRVQKIGPCLPTSWPSGPEAELSPYSIRRVSRFISAAESGRKKSPCQPSPHKAASRGTRCRGAPVRYLSAIHFTDDIASCQILLWLWCRKSSRRGLKHLPWGTFL